MQVKMAAYLKLAQQEWGRFLGIVDGNFRFSAGDGGDAASATSDGDTAVIQIALPDSRIPLDGQVHEIGAWIETTKGRIAMYVDGQFVEEAQVTSSPPEFQLEKWQGGDAAGFGWSVGGVCKGGVADKWPTYLNGGSLKSWVYD